MSRKRLKTAQPCERDEDKMKRAARELADAGGYRYRHYLVKVDSGRAACIEEFEPPRLGKILID